MYVDFGESFCGHETLDSVRGAQEIVAHIADVDEKVARMKQILPLLGLEDLDAQPLEIYAQRAFIRTDERPFNYRECLGQVQLYGRTGVIGQMFRYLYNEEEPEVNDLGLAIFDPVLIDFDVRAEYGVDTFSLQIPVRDIFLAKKVEALEN